MPVTANKPAPYATSGSMLDLIGRYRSRGLPTPIDGDALQRVGVPPSLIPRTLQSLHTLDLVDPKTGMPTQNFDALRLAPEDEYKKRLEAWLKGAYADVFAIVDPAKDGDARIRDAFRTYQPIGQQERMVLLFEGLCIAAGIIPEKVSAPRAPGNNRPARTSAPAPTSLRFVALAKAASKHHIVPKSLGGLPPALAGLLESLPDANEGWSRDDRQKFLTTFQAVLDFCIPVVPNTKNTGGDIAANG